MTSASLQVFRGDYLESQHDIDFLILSSSGVISSTSNVKELIFPRSSIKLLQAYDFVLSGAYAASQTSREQLALACASHNSEPIHIDLIKTWLHKNEFSEGDLVCGPSRPMQDEDYINLVKTNTPLSRFHNNCSGKHTAMLINTKHLGLDSKEYHIDGGPIQRRYLSNMEELCNENISTSHSLDGCGLPNYRLSLEQMAKAILNFGRLENKTNSSGKAVKTIYSAISEHPYLLGGKNRLCSDLISASKGRIIAKDGAEGVFTAYIRDKEISITMKVKDGSFRALESSFILLLAHYGLLSSTEEKALSPWLNKKILNSNGAVAGSFRLKAL